MAAGGRFLAFASFATNLVPADTNHQSDIFVRDLDATGFMSLCDPGADGVIGCPCSNPPAARARLRQLRRDGRRDPGASARRLPLDRQPGLHDERREADRVEHRLAVGRPNASGDVFGMGVRCTSGTLKRLYTTAAVGGSITAPTSARESPRSRRVGALGDAILAGQSRWYVVYYRDPIVLGGCPASSTFNATQTVA
jgi:hypothetical protein